MSIHTTRKGFAYGVVREGTVTVIVLLPQGTTTKEAA